MNELSWINTIFDPIYVDLTRMKFLIKQQKLLIFFLWLMPFNLFSQGNVDSTVVEKDSLSIQIDTLPGHAHTIQEINKRKPFSFITHVPADMLCLVKTPFRKKSIKPVIITVGITLLLLPADQIINDNFRRFADQASLDRRIRFHELVTLSGRSIGLRLPKNLNTAFYQVGESTPSLLLAGGFYLHGLLKHDHQSLKTAGDLTESFLVSGITIQLLKRISGRQQPVAARTNGGRWRPFPSLHKYNDNFSEYGAYPSGHLACMMSAITVLAENYPQKKWIRPVGYTLMSLTALAMINNGSHWISDYPLGIAIGYLAGKIVSHRRQVKKIK